MEKQYPQISVSHTARIVPQSRKRQIRRVLIEAGPGISDAHSSRGCAFGDFDNDGDLDILIVNVNEPPAFCATI